MKAFAAILLIVATNAVASTITYNVSLNTGSLVANAAAPFSLDFQFTDGGGTGDGNNTVTLSGFNFGGGSAAADGTATTFGGASGSPATSIVITDTSFFNEYTIGFTPGATLNFTVDLTANVDAGGVPDEFSFGILDSSGFEIPANGPGDSLLLADINQATPVLYSYSSDTSRNAAAGAPIALAAPVVTQQSSVGTPEPATVWLVGTAAALLFARRRFSR
jgi:hypothetical protein